MNGPVTDAMVEAGCRLLCMLDGDKPDRIIIHQAPMVYAWHRYRSQARMVIKAAIAAMPQTAAPAAPPAEVPLPEHAPAVDLGPGLREAIRLLDLLVWRSDRAAVAHLRSALNEAALAAERKGDAG